MGNDREWIPVNVELRKGFVMMSPWLFNIYIYIWMVWFERWNVKVLGKWLEPLSANGGR